ncbi:MAG: M12 family metallo-peptidase [Acidimicrobiales bacterium]
MTNDLAFNNKRQLHRWLDREYDNVVGADRSEGVMQVLYVDSLNDGDDGVNATAFYPHGMSPLGRKHGLVSELLANDVSEPNIYVGEGILAHELGHIFGLKHTFESYGITVQNCNKDYSTTPGSTTLDNGQINVMDYWGGKRITGFYLNHCQQVRAAEQRDRYLTKDGEVNYRKLKGGR